MELKEKLRILNDAAKYYVSCASSGYKRTALSGGIGLTARGGSCRSFTPDGRCISRLKILLTNYCVCYWVYCVNQASSDIEDLWREYYRSTFNPARVNEALMRQLMPARHWQNMPEAEIIHQTIANSAQRVEHLLKPQTSTRRINGR